MPLFANGLNEVIVATINIDSIVCIYSFIEIINLFYIDKGFIFALKTSY